MNSMSPWAAVANNELSNADNVVLKAAKYDTLFFEIINTGNSVWVNVKYKKKLAASFRVCYSPAADLEINASADKGEYLQLSVGSAIGKFLCHIYLPGGQADVLRFTTWFTPGTDLLIPYWPKDVLLSGDKKDDTTEGKIHVTQEGNRSGLIYFSITKPKMISVLYFQNLSALGEYCDLTGTSAGNSVGGKWPELGFSLPPANDKALPAGNQLVISDAYIKISSDVPDKEDGISKQFLNFLAEIYLQIPKPKTQHHDWPAVLDNGLQHLLYTHGCFSHNDGHSYFNAYLCDYETPPEIMVQLAVLLPLEDYKDWSKKEITETDEIIKGLDAFYDPKLKTIMRWLPYAEGKLTGDEEQKKPKVMDSWYLHHPLLNLSRMAIKGNPICRKLFLDSVDYAIKVARHFQYKWPVFYHMETLEIIKAETEPGKGGEKDVAGLYAHVMLQAYSLTGEKRFLSEAKKAADTLAGYGFELFYQANNTSFAAGALLRLYKITGNKKYLDLSYLCIANLMRNVRLWNCNYGYGKKYPTFFSIYPLNNAPYTAAYEEQEVFCAMHDFINHARGVNILPSVTLLITEFIKYIITRAVYYYPPMLPPDMIADKAKTGELDKKLWIALEDLNDGHEKSGAVGQEVYGAGNAFGILPRHFIKIKDRDFMIFCEYPHRLIASSKEKITIKIIGDEALECSVALIPGTKKIPASIKAYQNKTQLKGKLFDDGRKEFIVKGGSSITFQF